MVLASTAAVGARVPAGAPARLVALDLLRLVAAVAVVVYHFTARRTSAWQGVQDVAVPEVVTRWTTYGALGPELFFVISGFVILMTAWGRTTAAVVASRIGRLYPSYWVAVLLTGALLLLVWPAGKAVTPGQVAVNLTMLQEAVGVDHVDGVYWTLWTELRFYLLVGLLVLAGVTRRRVLAMALLWPPFGLLMAHLGAADLAELVISDYAPFFAAGMALYLVHRDGHAVVPWLVVLGNTVLAVVVRTSATVTGLGHITGIEPPRAGVAVALVLCVALVAVVAVVPTPGLDRSWLVAAAALTYPLYLVHQYWGLWVISRLVGRVPAWLAVLAALAVSCVLAWTVHRLVEARYAPSLRRVAERALVRVRDALLERVNAGPRALRAADRIAVVPGGARATPGRSRDIAPTWTAGDREAAD